MKLISCYKVVHDDQDIRVNADRSLDLDKAGLKISLYDLNAIEAAVELAASQEGSSVTALSVGAKSVVDNGKLRKDVLSRGPNDLTLVTDDSFVGMLPSQTSDVLAKAAAKIGFDLILCGEGSDDLYAQQTGLLMGEKLGVPCINGVKSIAAGDGIVTVERELDDEIETLEITLPAVLCVSSDINKPKLPSMKAILGAGKKPVTQWSAADIGYENGTQDVVAESVLAQQQAERLNVIIEGDSDDDINAFAEHLRKVFN